MPIQIQYKNYTDIFGNTLNYYQANAGDKLSMEMKIHSSIRISSLDSPLQLNLSAYPYEITSPSLSWIEEGFRLNDTVQVSVYDPFSATPAITPYPATIMYIDDQVIGLSTMSGWFDVTQQQYVTIQVTGRDRDTLEILSNHVLNNTAGTEFSLIDGEVTRLKFSAIDSMIIGATQSSVQTGLSSGQFETTATLERLANPGGNERAYMLTMDLIQSGVYDVNWFFTSNCLKHYIKFEWASLANEPFGKTIKVFNDSGNTGWFDEAYNTSIIDATLVQGITFLDYQYQTVGQFVIDSASTEFGFGSCYISIDDAYYKNRPFNQNELTIAIPSTDFTIGTPVTSSMNEFGAAYDFEITNITTVGTVHTVDFVFTPNAAMGTWFDSLELGNRQFYIWAKWGNVNLLVFSGQMETQPPIGGFLDPEAAQFFDHSEQLTDPTGTSLGFAGNLEDDVAFAGTFLLDNNEVYESMTARIEAFNTTTLEKFTLNSVFFDFTSVPYSGGQHLLNLTIPVQTQLPTTSVKRDASLFLYPSINTGSQYGINLYFPFLYRWEYWLNQSNADADFYPNLQTKNWYPYGSTGDWTVRLHVELIKDGLAYVFDDEVTIKNYDSDPTIDQTIDIYRVSTNQLVNVIVEGEMHRIVATHTLNDGSAWNTTNIWGMITVEPTESSPRYIVSTVVPYDYNPSNPLEPISGALVNITYPTPDVAVMECFFDANAIDLSNGVKFTTKIKGCAGDEYFSQKITTTLLDKQTTLGENKSIA
jgi:hypothetical protein